MTATPITTIVPVYNGGPFLRRAVESLLATGYPQLEIVIVDDGSRDNSLAVARELAHEFAPCVRVLQHPQGQRRGVSASRNLGIQESNGAWLSFLDADDYVHPHRFASATQLLNERPDVDGVYQLCELVFADEQARHNWHDGRSSFGFSETIASDALIYRLLTGRCWATSAITFRRTLLERTGLFDPQLKIAEDCHLWFRMAVAGTLVAGELTQPVSVYWRHNASAYQPAAPLRLAMIRAMTRFLRWLSAHSPRDPRLARIKAAIANYILGGIVDARSKDEKRLAWALALRSLPMFPELVGYRHWYGHVVRMSLGR